MTWKIYMYEDRSKPEWVLPAGWFGGKPTSINQPIYMRTPDEEQAAVFQDKHDVIDRVRSFRKSGYACHAVPPIVIHEII